jgi:hypothetical protein
MSLGFLSPGSFASWVLFRVGISCGCVLYFPKLSVFHNRTAIQLTAGLADHAVIPAPLLPAPAPLPAVVHLPQPHKRRKKSGDADVSKRLHDASSLVTKTLAYVNQ